MNWSQPSSSVHVILQAKILEWVAMPSSSGSSPPRDWTCISCGSCIGRWALYHWATGESPGWCHVPFNQFPPMEISCQTIVQHHKQDFVIDTVKIQDISIPTRIPPVFITTPISTCPPAFNLWQPLIGSPFITFSEYYVWNATVYKLLELAFSLKIILWGFIYAEYIDNSFLLLLSYYFMLWVYHSLTVHPWKDIWVVSG